MSCQRQPVGIKWHFHIRNTDTTRLPSIQEIIDNWRFTLFGHVVRFDARIPAHQGLKLSNATRSGHRPDACRSIGPSYSCVQQIGDHYSERRCSSTDIAGHRYGSSLRWWWWWWGGMAAQQWSQRGSPSKDLESLRSLRGGTTALYQGPRWALMVHQTRIAPGVYLDFLTRGGWSQCQGVADQINFANVPLWCAILIWQFLTRGRINTAWLGGSRIFQGITRPL